jgi:hypothetical protein
MTKILSCAAVLGLLVASSSSVFAKGPGGGASHFTPAYASQNPSSSTLKPVQGLSGPAAYAPGQQMRAYGSGSEMAHRFTPQASSNNPGHLPSVE